MTGKLFCPACGHDISKVLDVRGFKKRKGVYRRHQCRACHFKFTSEQQVKPVHRSGAKRLEVFALQPVVVRPASST